MSKSKGQTITYGLHYRTLQICNLPETNLQKQACVKVRDFEEHASLPGRSAMYCNTIAQMLLTGFGRHLFLLGFDLYHFGCFCLLHQAHFCEHCFVRLYWAPFWVLLLAPFWALLFAPFWQDFDDHICQHLNLTPPPPFNHHQ